MLLLEVSIPQRPELHLDVSTLQRLVLLREVSTPQGPELHLDMSTLKRPVLLLEVSTPQGPELHLDVSTVYTTVACAATEVSTVHHRALNCSFTCLH